MLGGMRTSRAVLLGMALNLLFLVGASAVWVWQPWNPVNPWNACRIIEGMPVNQVEAILGPPTLSNRSEVKREGDPGMWTADWFGEDSVISVTFDGKDQVVGTDFLNLDPPSLRQRVRKWLGLLPESGPIEQSP